MLLGLVSQDKVAKEPTASENTQDQDVAGGGDDVQPRRRQANLHDVLNVFGFQMQGAGAASGGQEVENPGADSTQPLRAEEDREEDDATVVGNPEALAETVIEESQSPIPASQPRTPTKARMHPRTPPARPSHAEFQKSPRAYTSPQELPRTSRNCLILHDPPKRASELKSICV